MTDKPRPRLPLVPKIKVSEAIKIYCDEFVADEIAGKSPAQRKQWEKVKGAVAAAMARTGPTGPV